MVHPSKARPEDKPTKSSNAFRAREVDILEEKLRANNGGTVILAGRRGVGKSRLASQVIRQTTALPRHLVLESRVRADGGHGFEAWGEIVRQAIQWADVAGLSAAVIDPVINELESVLQSHQPEPQTHPSLKQKLKFFGAVLKLLAGVCEHVRMLLVLHDLDRANGDTFDLAQFLSDNLFDDPKLMTEHQRPGLILYLVREHGPNPPQVDEFLSQSADHPNIEKMVLEGFDLEGLRNYVQSEHILNKLLSASGGLPQQVDELLDGLPKNVETLFERRLENLGSHHRRLLDSLAVFGRPATAHQLATTLGCALSDAAQGLRGLREDKILERHIKNGEIQFSFSRSSNLDLTLSNLKPEQIAECHSGWAKALEASNGPTNASQLAHHFLRSTTPKRGLDLALRASEAHAVSGAFDAATNLLSLALPHAQNDLRHDILSRLIDLAAFSGRAATAAQYIEDFKAGLPAEKHGPVLLKEAQLLNQSGDYEIAIGRLEAARPLLDETERLVVLEICLAEAQYQMGDLKPAEASGQRALSRLTDDKNIACIQQVIDVLNLLGKIAVAQQQRPRALEFFEQTLNLAREKKIGHSEARALINLGVTHLKDGNLAEAEPYLKQGVESARRGEHLERIAFGSLNLGVLFHQRGDLAAAIAEYSECRSLFRRLGNRTQLARVLYNLGLLYRMVGDEDRARAHNREAERMARRGNVERLHFLTRVFDARLAADDGRFEDAEQSIRTVIKEHHDSASDVPTSALIEYGQILLESGHAEEALSSLRETLQSLTERCSLSLHARTQMLIGLCLSRLDHEDASKALNRAKQECLVLKEKLLLRDIEIAMAKHSIRVGEKQRAAQELNAAQKLQSRVFEELPASLQASFSKAHAQKEIEQLRQELHPKNRVTPVTKPRPTSKRNQRPSSTTVVNARDKLAWAQKYPQLIGQSQKLYKLFRILDRIAPSENTVLISGESGTGKELVAQAIHNNSRRAQGAFVKLNCAALVESLLLSELFGHERGAFTGAHQRKIGRFELAAGGTLFLDEIGDVSAKTQVALLRVLQEFEFERVGGGHPIKLQARVIFATNRNLIQMVRDGQFREDLYYRLKGLSVELPRLKDRAEDVGLLAQHFLEKQVDESGRCKALSNAALAALTAYHWPGNVRELENVIRSIALFTDGDLITQNDLEEYRELFEESASFSDEADKASAFTEEEAPEAPSALFSDRELNDDVPMYSARARPEALLSEIFDNGTSLADLKRQIQDQAIVHALTSSGGNITQAAQMLGMKRPRLSQIINANEGLKDLCQEVSK